jgi:hypothetical protein
MNLHKYHIKYIASNTPDQVDETDYFTQAIPTREEIQRTILEQLTVSGLNIIWIDVVDIKKLELTEQDKIEYTRALLMWQERSRKLGDFL